LITVKARVLKFGGNELFMAGEEPWEGSLRGQKGRNKASGSWDTHISQGKTPNERELCHHRDAPLAGRHRFATMLKKLE
jgi:hypothetical protein